MRLLRRLSPDVARGERDGDGDRSAFGAVAAGRAEGGLADDRDRLRLAELAPVETGRVAAGEAPSREAPLRVRPVEDALAGRCDRLANVKRLSVVGRLRWPDGLVLRCRLGADWRWFPSIRGDCPRG